MNYTIKRKTNFNPLSAIQKFYDVKETRYYAVNDAYGNEIYKLKMTCEYIGEGTGLLSSDKDYEIYDSNNSKLGFMYMRSNGRKELRINGSVIDYYCDITDRSYLKGTKSLWGNVLKELAHSKDLTYGLNNRRWTSKNKKIYNSSGQVIASYSFYESGLFSKEGANLNLARDLSQNDFLCVLLLVFGDVFFPEK